jgi:hypothetical protein
MLHRVRARLTYANVVSTLCLFVLLGGSAYAVSRIDGRDIRDRSIPGTKLREGSVGPAELAARARSALTAGVPPDFVRSTQAVSCDPGEPPKTCAEVAVNLSAVTGSRLAAQWNLVIVVNAKWFNKGETNAVEGGRCAVTYDGSPVDAMNVGELALGARTGSLGLNVTRSSRIGKHTLRLVCNEVARQPGAGDPDIFLRDIRITVVGLIR